MGIGLDLEESGGEHSSMKSITRILTVAGISACLAATGLVGCSQQEETVEEEPVVVEEQQPSYDLVIGTESDDVVNLPITNDTDLTIVGLQFKSVGAAEYSANVMASDQAWEPGQVADVFFEGVALGEDGEADDASSNALAAASASGEDLLLSDVYDVQFTAVGGSAFVLHQLSLASLVDTEDLAVNYDAISGLGYLTYMEDGAQASTLEAEQAIADEAAAIAQAEAEAAAAEAAAQAAAEAEAAAQQSKSSNGGSGSKSSGYDSTTSGSGSGSTPAQREDYCIDPDDVLLN